MSAGREFIDEGGIGCEFVEFVDAMNLSRERGTADQPYAFA